MSQVTADASRSGIWNQMLSAGMFWLIVSCVCAAVFFYDGLEALFVAWQLPEYSHGPLIPILSGVLFLRQLKEFPPAPGPKTDRFPGLVVILASLLLGTLGILSGINDIVAYALILWIGGLLLVSFGWRTGKHFWPPVVHLVYMLPLPGVIYYKMTTSLQLVSSELGVWFLRLLDVPVFLDGNIIDLGTLKLHVAEACSGLRYLFPILSFSYIFAVLYRGSIWHKAVLLISAAPITVFMNSVRIAIAGVIAQRYGVDWLEGFTHFFEGWVIFISCIVLLFALAWCMLRLQRSPMSLSEALDLETDGLGTQALRLRFVQPSMAMVTSALILMGSVGALQLVPERGENKMSRDPFIVFPKTIGDWEQRGRRYLLSQGIEAVLGADDYHQVDLVNPNVTGSVGLFLAWYDDQSKGGVHSPEICLPGAGWEIAWLERTDITEKMGTTMPFRINRAIIQKGEVRMMVYYWFHQKDRNIAWDFAAKFWLMVDGIKTGRTDGGMVRLTTPILNDETDAQAEERLEDVLNALQGTLPRFMPRG